MRPSRIGALETMAIFVTVSESYTITVIYDTQCNIDSSLCYLYEFFLLFTKYNSGYRESMQNVSKGCWQ